MYTCTKFYFYCDDSCNLLLHEFICDKFGSLRKFAKYLNYSPAFVSAFINGKKPIPSKVIEKVFIDYGFDILKGIYSGVTEKELK